MRTGPFQSLVACFVGAFSIAAAITPASAEAAPHRAAAARLHASAAHTRHAAHRIRTPIEAYLFVPGLGTVVVSVKADGRTTVAPVPEHLNESNFSVGSHPLELRTARFHPGMRNTVKSSSYATKRRAV